MRHDVVVYTDPVVKALVERLRTEINGKVIRFQEFAGEHSNDLLFDIEIILLWPPGGPKVTLKPFGYTEAELYEALNHQYDRNRIARRDFCMGAYLVDNQYILDPGKIRWLLELAKIPEGGIYEQNAICGAARYTPIGSSPLGGFAVCPY